MIALARALTNHIKNRRAICRMPKTMYHVLLHLFWIHSFSIALIKLLNIVLLNNLYIFNFLFFFLHIVTSGFFMYLLPC